MNDHDQILSESFSISDELFGPRPRAEDSANYGIATEFADREAARLLVSGLWDDPLRRASEDNSLNSLNSQVDQFHAPIQWPDPLGEAAYHGLAGEFVAAVEPHTEADPAALLVQFLVAFGNVVGRRVYFVAEADKHFCNLFAVIVGISSKGRKGSSWGRTKSVVGSTDNSWGRDCIVKGLSSGEGLIWAVRDPIEKHEPIKEKGRVVDYQNVVTDQGVDDKRLLVVESEFASVLKRASLEGNSLSAIIRQAWDDGDLRSLTKNSLARSTDAHISIIGHITRDELKRHLEDTETANGFANRFLWACSKQSKLLPEGGNMNQVDFSRINKDLKNAVDHASGATEMRRNEEARELWFEVYPSLAEGKPGLLGAVTGRAEAQVMRLAMIYALLDCESMIGRQHLEAALAVWKYCEDSTRYIFGEAMGDPVADSILDALKEAGADGLTRTQLSDLFKRHTSAAAIHRALSSLSEAGRVASRKEPKESPEGGRPVERWFALTPVAKKAKEAKKLPGDATGSDLISHNSLISQSVTEDIEVF
jgi:hypothetical protein